jgi:lipoyl(octanoyl) transferase
MPTRPSQNHWQSPALNAFLLGQVDFDRALDLQRRLLSECRDRDDGQITLLLCEHPAIITIGRGGSPGEVSTQSGLVRNRQIEIRWVNRGGGCLVHCPGQLAVYPLIPLRWHGFSIGQFLERFHTGIVETLDDLNIPAAGWPENDNAHPLQRVGGIWGRTGQLAAIGIAVRHWVTYYGAYLNVCPPMGLFRLVEAEKGTGPICAKHPEGRPGKLDLSPFPPRMSCLVAERRGPVRMTAVREALIRRLADCFGCDRYHVFTGHPLLRSRSQEDRGPLLS